MRHLPDATHQRALPLPVSTMCPHQPSSITPRHNANPTDRGARQRHNVSPPHLHLVNSPQYSGRSHSHFTTVVRHRYYRYYRYPLHGHMVHLLVHDARYRYRYYQYRGHGQMVHLLVHDARYRYRYRGYGHMVHLWVHDTGTGTTGTGHMDTW